MKSTIKLVLIAVLFTSTIFADGDLGNGSKSCPSGHCLTSNQPIEIEGKTDESKESMLDSVQEYLNLIYKYFEN